jgi:hypothetical protein
MAFCFVTVFCLNDTYGGGDARLFVEEFSVATTLFFLFVSVSLRLFAVCVFSPFVLVYSAVPV